MLLMLVSYEILHIYGTFVNVISINLLFTSTDAKT